MTSRRMAFLVSLLALLTRPVLGDGVVRDGVGATSGGRGGTNIAHSDNGTVLLDNPAGIVNINGSGLFELGLDGLLTDLDYSDLQNDRVGARTIPIGLPSLSYIRKSCDGQWAYGIGVYAPAGFGAKWDMNGPPELPGQQGYKSFGAMVKILPGIAYRVTDQLSVGATLGLAIGRNELTGPFFMRGAPPIPTLFDIQADGTALTWSVGMQYQLSAQTTLGLSYIEETRFHLDGNADAKVEVAPGVFMPANFNDAQVNITWPRSLGLGVKHDLCDCQRVSLDVLWINWSNAFDDVGLNLSDVTTPIPGITTVHDRFPLKWDDSISVRLGYEYFLSDCDTLRAGYVYNSGNVPSSTLTPYIPGILEHSFTIGYGKRWTNWTFDAAYQYSFSPERHVGTSDVAGGDFSNSEITAQAHWLLWSVSYRF